MIRYFLTKELMDLKYLKKPLLLLTERLHKKDILIVFSVFKIKNTNLLIIFFLSLNNKNNTKH